MARAQTRACVWSLGWIPSCAALELKLKEASAGGNQRGFQRGRSRDTHAREVLIKLAPSLSPRLPGHFIFGPDTLRLI